MSCAGGTDAQYAILHLDGTGVRVEHRSVGYDQKALLAETSDYFAKAGPVGWLELSQLLLARPLMLHYFGGRFDRARGADLDYLSQSVRSHLEEQGALAAVEAQLGPLGS